MLCSFRPRNLRETAVDLQTKASADTHHFIGANRGLPDAKHCIALLQKAYCDGMEDFIETFVANFPGPGKINQGKRQPLTQNWDVPGAEDG
jgi:hypothetical protein